MKKILPKVEFKAIGKSPPEEGLGKGTLGSQWSEKSSVPLELL